MSKLRDIFYQLTNQSEHSYDAFRIKLLEYMGQKPAIRIYPYTSFGNYSSLFVKGRVLHHQNIEVADDDELWDNLVNMFRRFNTHEVKGAELKLSYRSVVKHITTDEDGYFGDSLELPEEWLSGEMWHYPELELLSPKPEAVVKSVAPVMVPQHTASFGIISDIDDTILKTNTTSVVSMLLETFTGNAKGRQSFAGTSAFYNALQKGRSGNDYNPVFYISSSPWNLYDLLTDFIRLNELPAGPMFLKDYGFTHNKIFTEGHDIHKPKKIKKVMDAFPEMKFILIGDSGQEDAAIYHEADKLYPGRILGIYIRDVGHPDHAGKVKAIFSGESERKILSATTLHHAEHACAMGWITSKSLEIVRKAVTSPEGGK